MIHYKRSFPTFSVYLTDVKTVNEIGIKFSRESSCYLGEIVLEGMKHNRYGEFCDTPSPTCRILSSLRNNNALALFARDVSREVRPTTWVRESNPKFVRVR